MYTIDYNARNVVMSNTFYCFIRLERLLCDAECDLLAIAKFLVI